MDSFSRYPRSVQGLSSIGHPVGFHPTGGRAHELAAANHLLPELLADLLATDQTYDADARVIDRLTVAGKAAVIPVGPEITRACKKHPYSTNRRLIENFSAEIDWSRAIAARYDKTARDFLATVHPVARVVRLHL